MVTLVTILTGSDNMAVDFERIIHPNAPDPQQLRRLASVGINSAVSRDKLRHLQRSNNSHYFIDEIDRQGSRVVGDRIEDLVHIRHRMSGRVGARNEVGQPRIWSLKYYDTYWANADGTWLGERTLYRFEWNRTRTLLAERTFRLVGIDQPDFDMGEQILNFSFPDDAADIWHAQQQVETVTRDDCEELIRDATNYFEEIEAIHNAA